MLYEFDLAEVAENNDDEFKGRIKIICESLRGDQVHDFWIENISNRIGKTDGQLDIPDIGDQVYILIPYHMEDLGRSPYNIFWMGMNAKAEVPAEFKVNYPNRRGYWSDAGFFILDQTPGKETVWLQHSNGMSFRIYPKKIKVDSGAATIADSKIILDKVPWAHQHAVPGAGLSGFPQPGPGWVEPPDE